jgi:hypothetical protein
MDTRFQEAWASSRIAAAYKLNDTDRNNVLRIGGDAERVLHISPSEAGELLSKLGVALSGKTQVYQKLKAKNT